MQTGTLTPLCLIFKVDTQQGPTVENRELCSVSGGSLDGRGVWGRMDRWVCMAESLCCAPETITTLLAGYTPMQNLQTNKHKTSTPAFGMIFQSPPLSSLPLQFVLL